MTKKQKIQYLIDNTKNLSESQELYWNNYLTLGLIFKEFSHSLLDDFITHVKETNGECPLLRLPESKIHNQ